MCSSIFETEIPESIANSRPQTTKSKARIPGKHLKLNKFKHLFIN